MSLPHAKSEVETCHRLLKTEPAPFVNEAAQKSRFFLLAPHADILHFACHHFFDAQAPMLSFLKLAGDRGSDFLYAFEIAETQMQAKLVVLSACETGRSRVETGDEQFGIVRAFLAAGAQSTISTLWPIEDESASLLFTKFYENLREHNVAEALARAQRALISNPRFALPNFWAAYLASGTSGPCEPGHDSATQS